MLANNPSESGFIAIQDFYTEQKLKPPIAVVVSIGTGRYDSTDLGNTDLHKRLAPGKHWLNPLGVWKTFKNFTTLLSEAVSEWVYIILALITYSHTKYFIHALHIV